MNIFEYENYKKYVKDRVDNMPKRGHGYYTKLANHLSVTTVLISQIFQNDRELTVEQALALSEFFGFIELETDYFVTLVERERAGTHQLKKYFSTKLKVIKDKSKTIKENVQANKELSEEARSEFYSHWYYIAIWMSTAIEGINNPESISEKLGLDLLTVNKTLAFLIRHGLIIKTKEILTNGPTLIHIESSSVHVAKHHVNWRIQGLSQMDRISDEEICFTMPCTLSSADFSKIRSEIINLIKKSTAIIEPSKSEEIAFMNIDWLRFKAKKIN